MSTTLMAIEKRDPVKLVTVTKEELSKFLDEYDNLFISAHDLSYIKNFKNNDIVGVLLGDIENIDDKTTKLFFHNIKYYNHHYITQEDMSSETIPKIYPESRVTLLHYTPLKIADIAVGTCWDKPSGEENINCERLDRVINKFAHSSTSEHLFYNFYIKNISRTVLQELARHRIASFSVKSTRYTLKELKIIDEPFCTYSVASDGTLNIHVTKEKLKAAEQYLVLTGKLSTDLKSISALEQLRLEIKSGTSNDISKYAMPESYKTELTFSINARSLSNFLSLRTSKKALWEIRELAYDIYNALPDDHKFLFESKIKKEGM